MCSQGVSATTEGRATVNSIAAFIGGRFGLKGAAIAATFMDQVVDFAESEIPPQEECRA